MTAFMVAQIAVGVLLGNVATRCLFRGWERVRQERVDLTTAAFYGAPLVLIILVLVGSAD